MPIAPREGGGLFEGSSRADVERFKTVLEGARIPATVRLTRGRDIEAACGQLAALPRSSAPSDPPGSPAASLPPWQATAPSASA
jgi:hypothetical protein